MSEARGTSTGRTSSEKSDQERTATPERPPEEQLFHCDLCGHVMLNLHCKLVCEQCGYKRDCSDP